MSSQIVTRYRRSERDSGAVAVLVALLATVLIGMGAFTVDLANAYAVKRELSSAADSASLDGARAAAATSVSGVPILTAGQSCATWTSEQAAAAQTAAQAAAIATNDANDASGQSTVDSVSLSCVDGSIQVTVNNSRTTPSFFGGVFGASSYHPNAQATSRVVWTRSTGGLRPFAVCDQVVDQARTNPDETFVTGVNNRIGGCGTSAPTRWGYVDFTGRGSRSDLLNWTVNGYPNSVSAPSSSLRANVGRTPWGLASALRSQLGDVVLFPVVSGYNTGSPASFDLVGFMAATVCGYRVGWWSTPSYLRPSCYDDALAQQYNSPRVNYIQIRYATFTTGYTGQGPTCIAGSSTCQYSLPAAQLYR